jgi:hypothetical protein
VAAAVVGAFAAGAGVAAIVHAGLFNGIAGVDDAQATGACAPHLVDVDHLDILLSFVAVSFSSAIPESQRTHGCFGKP